MPTDTPNLTNEVRAAAESLLQANASHIASGNRLSTVRNSMMMTMERNAIERFEYQGRRITLVSATETERVGLARLRQLVEEAPDISDEVKRRLLDDAKMDFAKNAHVRID